jgi:tetratricopeptide (TPR) repeat protein
MSVRRLAFLSTAALLLVAGGASAQLFSRGNGLVNEAAYALDRENWSQGTALAREALRSGELMPGNIPAAYNNLCIGLTGLGKYDEAMEACNKAVEMRPRQWSFYNNRANIYYYRGEYDRALAEYYKAMTFSPGDDVLLQNIALTLRVRKQRNPNAPASNQSS